MRKAFHARFMGVCASAPLWALVGTSAAYGAEQLAADEPAAEAEAPYDTIVVTARRREENIQSVPLAITALSAEGLQKGSVRQSSDLQYVTPGLTFTQGSDSRQNAAFNIRGAGQAFGGNLPSVLSYFADIPLDFHGAAGFGVYDMANVQVARGPQGTLFGRNTTAGAVLFVPQAPTKNLEGFVSGELGNYNLRHVQGALNLPITEALAVRLSGDIVRRGGTTLNLTTGNKLDSRHQESARVFVRWDPAEGIRNDTVAQYLHANEAGVPHILASVRTDGDTAATRSSAYNALYDLYGGPTGAAQYLAAQARRGPRVTQLNFDPRESRSITVVANTTSIDLAENVTLKNILGYERVKTNYSTDIDGTPQDINFSKGNLGVPEYSTRQWSDELQLSGQTSDNRLNWIAGFFWLDSKTPESGFVNGRESLSNLTFRGDGIPAPSAYSFSRNSQAIHDKSKAVYAQATYGVTDTIRITGGFRYSWDSRASTTGQMATVVGPGGPFLCRAVRADGTSLPTSTPQDQCLTTIKGKFDDYGYTIALDWQPTPDTLAYATTRRNFKDGGQNFVNTLDTGLLTYQPEIATDYEVGIKQSWNSGGFRGHANVALYLDKYTNMQRQVTVNTGTAVSTLIFNAAKATIKGAEFEASASLANFTLSLFYTYTDAKYDRFVDPATGADLSANKFVGTPKNAVGGSLTYRAELGDNLGRLEPTVSFYKPGSYAYNPNQVANPGTFTKTYTLLNARVDWREVGGLPLDIGAFVNNLTDKDYIIAGLGLFGSTLGYNSVVYGAPRTYGLQMTYRFGN